MGLIDLADRFTRALQDQATVEAKLPAATRHLTVEGVRGWLYPVTTEAGDAFKLFLFFDGASYQVKVVEPDLEGRYDPHASHLMPDGRICLSDDRGGGVPSLETAYARSVVWCTWFGAFRRDEHFPL
jgi:hypothetical protein